MAVVSPHLDDAVLSLGATIARLVREGLAVAVVTVLAGDPASRAPASRWDRACGFGTQGDAAARRREEDRRACAALGAEPRWLPFAGVSYGGPPDEDAAWAALEPALAGAARVLVPGWPLEHADHVWAAGLVRRRSAAPVVLYAEEPYASRVGRAPEVDGVGWEPSAVTWADRRAKGRACRSYRSQFLRRRHLPRRLLLPELLRRDELLGTPLTRAAG